MNKITFPTELRLDRPNYYRCHFNLVDLYVQQRTGISMPSLLANAELYSIPVFGVDTTDADPIPGRYFAEKLFDWQNPFFDFVLTSTPSLETGLEYLQASIQQGQLVIVSGSTYELPYAPEYHQAYYFEARPMPGTEGMARNDNEITTNDHMVAVIGISQEEVLIYDPMPYPFLGNIPLADFCRFWHGNVQFDQFRTYRGYGQLRAYGIAEVHLKPTCDQPFDELALKVLANVGAAYLEGRTRTRPGRDYLSGIAVNQYLHKRVQEQYAATSQLSARLSKTFYDLRWSQYYFRDFLQELCDLGTLPLQALLQELLVIINQGEQLFTMHARLTRQGKQLRADDAQTFIALLGQAVTRERRLHEQLSALSNIKADSQ